MRYIALSWDGRTPAKKIGLTKAIRSSTELGLAAAKRCTDRCLEGETVVVTLRTDADAAEFIAMIHTLGWGARPIDEDEFDPGSQLLTQQLQEWNRTVDHELQSVDFCRDDAPWSYFVAAPLRTIDTFVRSHRCWPTEQGQQTVVRIVRGRHCPYPRQMFLE